MNRLSFGAITCRTRVFNRGASVLALALLNGLLSSTPSSAQAPAVAPAAEAPKPSSSRTRMPDCAPLKAEDLRVRSRRRPGDAGIDCVPTYDEAADPELRRQLRDESLIEPRVYSDVPSPAQIKAPAIVPVPDRWRIVDTLYGDNRLDPYNRNVLKGDKPVRNGDEFFSVTAIADTVLQTQRSPTPVGFQSIDRPDSNDVFGRSRQEVFAETLLVELVYLKGNTVFRPPDYEFRLTPAFQYNRVEVEETLALNVDPRRGRTRSDRHFGLQAAFYDYHIRDVSENYDFDSVRVGIQPITADFRGFLFNDSPLGVRLFGTRKNNIFQYNLGLFRRLEKDTNSGLNDLGESPRKDDVFIANLYWQDLFKLGLNSQFALLHNRNREDGEFYFDRNGFIARPASFGDERPRRYDVSYLGYSVDGHIDRLNISGSTYYAFGHEKNGAFSSEPSDIRAGFAAAELSIDYSWIRPRVSLLYATGDSDPFDNRSEGFDAIFENPLFAGADTSYWIRQSVPLIGGGRVALSGRNGLLNSLRSSKEQGQSNFVNPGLGLVGAGVDLDLTPELRLSFNANGLWFDETAVLEVARQQADIPKHIGTDVSAAVIWRPFMSQNIVMRLSYASLLPGSGYKALFPDQGRPHSLLANLILTY
ncbi:hypothetical protein [Aquimonas sp.]|uniref:hypothetical protein n=1 Tax=Aquimonas sp. TaxID=1872588 RepID=UPI0037BEB0C5